ncbi:MAG: permease [Candidatus Hadarchaeum sp.]|uniref:permease n=1 Tax=Candidatus Hadarchaeum sp. TaxID=2883567 RepID=UPI003D1210E7
MYDIIKPGFDALAEYLSAHVLTCLVPAFFISGAIAALVSKDTVIKYFGARTKKWLSYGVASISGAILAVCSCTILPMFQGIYKRGAGIGPAFAFLFSGPAINVLAIVFTASVLGFDIGIARAVSSVSMAVIVGLIMATIFERGAKGETASVAPAVAQVETAARTRPKYISPIFFVLLIAILLIGASGLISLLFRLAVVYLLTIAVAVILIFYYTRDEVKSWGHETWWVTKKIFPILLVGVFIVGVIGGVAANFSPSHDPSTAVGELTKPYLGNNTLFACLLASVIGALLYMPTLLEVPIIGTFFGYSSGLMAPGPALALLLAGPALSLPSMVVLVRMVGWKKAGVYIALVVIIATMIGMIYGALA